MSHYTRMDVDAPDDKEENVQKNLDEAENPPAGQPSQVILLLANPTNTNTIANSPACQACMTVVPDYPWKLSLGLSIAEISMALVSVIVNIIGKQEYTEGSSGGPGIWTAILVAAAGVLGIIASCKNNKGIVLAFFVLSILGAISGLILCVLGTSYLVRVLRWNWLPDIVISALYAGVGLTMMVLTVNTAILSGKTLKNTPQSKPEETTNNQQNGLTMNPSGQVVYVAQPMVLLPAGQGAIANQGMTFAKLDNTQSLLTPKI